MDTTTTESRAACLPCERWRRYSAALDEFPFPPNTQQLRCEPCPIHDGWTFAEAAADLWASHGGVHPLTVGAVLRAREDRA
jgi:hypothetical protein